MAANKILTTVGAMAFVGLSVHAFDAQQYPVVDLIANRIIQKYQQATCEQLWLEKANRNKPQSPQEQEALGVLRSNPAMRTALIQQVAAPVVEKMFDCGMIP